jgi:hypothetical protein
VPLPLIAKRISRYANPFEFNPHHSFLAMSRSGKSYLIRRGVLPVYGMSRIVVMDVKPGGERTWDGYGNDVTVLKPGFGLGQDGTPHYRFRATNKADTERFIDMISNEGSCIIVFDDSRRVTANKPDYGLSSPVDNLMTIGAAIGITIIICANSTTWVTSGLRDQCAVNWLGQMQNEKQRAEFTEIAGLPRKEIMPILGTLPRRHFLYSDRYDESGELKLAITRISND